MSKHTILPGYRYDPKSRRYRDANDRIVPKRDAVVGASTPRAGSEFWGEFIPIRQSARPEKEIAVLAGEIERNIIAAYTDNIEAETPDPDPIPQRVLASYALAEHYLRTEGDVAQYVEVPIDVAFGGDLEVFHPDPGIQRELSERYVSRLDIWNILYQIWLSVASYGVAYPLEVPEAPLGEIVKVVLLPPRYMWVGRGVSRSDDYPPSNYSLKPMGRLWNEDVLRETFTPIMYNAFDIDENEQVPGWWNLKIAPNVLFPVRGKSLDYTRYPPVPIARAFRQIAMRVAFDEMVRGSLEGYRNQLWLFLLNDDAKGNPPRPSEIRALKEAVTEITEARTGNLVWRGNLSVQVVAPKAFDQMLNPDMWHNFTLAIFRQLGVSARIVTGNELGLKNSTKPEVDMSIWFRRLEFMRQQVMNWEKRFRVRWAQSTGDQRLAESAASAKVRFSKSLLEIGDLIEKQLRPLFMLGLLSRETTLEEAGYDYPSERARKQKEYRETYMWGPPASFAQTVVSPQTQRVEKVVESPLPEGGEKTEKEDQLPGE